MNTTPTIKVTGDGPEVGVTTARLPLQHAIEKEKQNGCDEDPDLARKRAMNELTGASIFLPPKVMPVDESADKAKKVAPTTNTPVSFTDEQP